MGRETCRGPAARALQGSARAEDPEESPEIRAQGSNLIAVTYLVAGFLPSALASGAASGFTMSSNCTSKTNVEPGGICGGAPRSPYASSDGHTTLLLPPTFMSCTASVQQGMTPLSGNVVGSPRWMELSNTVPFTSLPS